MMSREQAMERAHGIMPENVFESYGVAHGPTESKAWAYAVGYV